MTIISDRFTNFLNLVDEILELAEKYNISFRGLNLFTSETDVVNNITINVPSNVFNNRNFFSKAVVEKEISLICLKNSNLLNFSLDFLNKVKTYIDTSNINTDTNTNIDDIKYIIGDLLYNELTKHVNIDIFINLISNSDSNIESENTNLQNVIDELKSILEQFLKEGFTNSNNSDGKYGIIKHINLKQYIYEYHKIFFILKQTKNFIIEPVITLPNFDKNWVNPNSEIIPSFVIFNPLEISYSVIVNFLAYIVVKEFEYKDFITTLALIKSPISVIEEEYPEIKDIFNELRIRRTKTNLIHDVFSTLNKSINPQTTYIEMLEYLINGVDNGELNEWENIYNSIKQNIPQPQLDKKITNLKITDYILSGKYVLAQSKSTSITGHGLRTSEKIETHMVEPNYIMKSVPYFRRKIEIINSEIPLLKVDGDTGIVYYVNENINNTTTNLNTITNTNVNITTNLMSIFLPTTSWNSVLNYSRVVSSINKLYTLKYSGVVQNVITSTSYDNSLLSYDNLVMELLNKDNVSFTYNTHDNLLKFTYIDVVGIKTQFSF